MDAYVYQAALLCEDCGRLQRRTLNQIASDEAFGDGYAGPRVSVADDLAEALGFDPDDEGSYDSDEYPKGPYPEGGGEADCPQHCDQCGEFLENALTGEGVEYVREAIDEARAAGRVDSPALTIWAEFYSVYDGIA